MNQKALNEAEQRLAGSRRALFKYVNRESADSSAESQYSVDAGSQPYDAGDPARTRDEEHFEPVSAWAVTKKAGRIWWHYHPARTALAVVEPLMGAYAERHPWKLLGISAGLGAVAVVTRPWKLISLTGMALATLRSSQISAVIASLVTPDNEQKRRDYE